MLCILSVCLYHWNCIIVLLLILCIYCTVSNPYRAVLLVYTVQCTVYTVQAYTVQGRFEPPVTVIMQHAVTQGDWRFASPRLRLGIVASLLSVSIGSQHIVWLVYAVQQKLVNAKTENPLNQNSFELLL